MSEPNCELERGTLTFETVRKADYDRVRAALEGLLSVVELYGDEVLGWTQVAEKARDAREALNA